MGVRIPVVPQACEIRGPVVGIKVDERTPGPEVVLLVPGGVFSVQALDPPG